LIGSITILNKIQNNVVLIKKTKQKSTGYNRVFNQVLPGQPAGSHQVMTFSIFINPARFQPRVGQAPGQPAGPGFKTKKSMILIPILVNGHITRPSKYQLLSFLLLFLHQ
jgi:hypothetical protein